MIRRKYQRLDGHRFARCRINGLLSIDLERILVISMPKHIREHPATLGAAHTQLVIFPLIERSHQHHLSCIQKSAQEKHMWLANPNDRVCFIELIRKFVGVGRIREPAPVSNEAISMRALSEV